MSARILALCGGVGGAKLALGLMHVVAPDQLNIAVNTGDDFEHLGLTICPDIDTVTYTLAGVSNETLGWGLAGESWAFMDQLRRIGGETWFQLGDRDLALHVERKRRLNAGEPLSRITADMAARFGIACGVLPMTDDRVATVLHTEEGVLEFQRYFVERQAQVVVNAIEYRGADQARPSAEVLALLADPSLTGVIICPSNPWLSIDPLLAMPALRAALQQSPAPVIAISPIIGGRAVKGPTARLMAELGMPVTATEVARHYSDLIDGFMLDEIDGERVAEIEAMAIAVDVQQTLMHDLASKTNLAARAVEFVTSLRGR